MKMLFDQLAPKPLATAEKFKFRKRHQKEGESVAEVTAVLRCLAEHCEFGEKLEEQLTDQLVSGLQNAATQRKLLSKRNLTMSKAMEIVKAMEIAEMEAGHLLGTMTERKDDNQSSDALDVVRYRARMKRSTEVQKTSRDSKNACP